MTPGVADFRRVIANPGRFAGDVLRCWPRPSRSVLGRAVAPSALTAQPEFVLISYFGLFDFGLGRALTEMVAERVGGVADGELRPCARPGPPLPAPLGSRVV